MHESETPSFLRPRRLVLLLATTLTMVVGCPSTDPLPEVGIKESGRFKLLSFRINGQDVAPDSSFSFSPGEQISVEVGYSAEDASAFHEASIVLSCALKAEPTRMTAAETLFEANEGVNGEKRTLSGKLLMPPEHMVKFMEEHSRTRDFSCAVKDRNFVVAECRIGFVQGD